MENTQLRAYIKEQEKRGCSDEQIRGYLTKQGCSKKDINVAFGLHREDKTIFYSLVLFFSTIISALILIPIFIFLESSNTIKFFIAVIFGTINILLVKYATEKTRLWIFASSFTATAASVFVFLAAKTFSLLSEKLTQQMAKVSSESGAAMGMVSLLPETNPFVYTFLVYIGFILPTIIFFILDKERNNKDWIKFVINLVIMILIILILNFAAGYIFNFFMPG